MSIGDMINDDEKKYFNKNLKRRMRDIMGLTLVRRRIILSIGDMINDDEKKYFDKNLKRRMRDIMGLTLVRRRRGQQRDGEESAWCLLLPHLQYQLSDPPQLQHLPLNNLLWNR